MKIKDKCTTGPQKEIERLVLILLYSERLGNCRDSLERVRKRGRETKGKG
jgi:hypothetical protein